MIDEDYIRQAQKMEAVGRLAGGIAHDFNNLLTVITGRAELLLGRLGPADPLRRHVELIKATGASATGLTRQLLAFSRKEVLEPTVLDLNAVVAGMEKLLHRLLDAQIALQTVLRPGLGRVEADPVQLEQVILNLAVNARDAMPRGGRLTLETANVELDEASAPQRPGGRPGSYVMLAVSDTGIGMDAATQARMFEPFFTTKAKGQGTGLGLATVYGIIKQAGGNVWVSSEPGHGTTFEIYLPRVEERVEPSLEAATSLTELRGGSETLLLVEDEAGVRDLAQEILQVHGYTVLGARHPGEALLIAEAHAGPIDLLVTDLVMPHLSGRELAARLARLRPPIKVLLMSGSDVLMSGSDVLEPGTLTLQKPFTPEGLLRQVRQVLDTVALDRVPQDARDGRRVLAEEP